MSSAVRILPHALIRPLSQLDGFGARVIEPFCWGCGFINMRNAAFHSSQGDSGYWIRSRRGITTGKARCTPREFKKEGTKVSPSRAIKMLNWPFSGRNRWRRCPVVLYWYEVLIWWANWTNWNTLYEYWEMFDVRKRSRIFGWWSWRSGIRVGCWINSWRPQSTVKSYACTPRGEVLGKPSHSSWWALKPPANMILEVGLDVIYDSCHLVR